MDLNMNSKRNGSRRAGWIALALTGLVAAGCAGAAAGGDEAWAAKQCQARGMAPGAPGWQSCLDNEIAQLRGYRDQSTRIRGI